MEGIFKSVRGKLISFAPFAYKATASAPFLATSVRYWFASKMRFVTEQTASSSSTIRINSPRPWGAIALPWSVCPCASTLFRQRCRNAPTWSSTTFSGSSAMRGGTCVFHRTSSSRMAFSGASAAIVRFNSINDFDKLISLWLHVGRGSDKNTHFFDLSWHRRGYPKLLLAILIRGLKANQKEVH